jgi:hypothetical protein
VLAQRAVALAASLRLAGGRLSRGGAATQQPVAPGVRISPQPLVVQALFAPLGGLVLGGFWCFISGFKHGYVGALRGAAGLAGRAAGLSLGLLARGLRLGRP